MSFDDSVLNDLGIKDNSGEKDDGFEKFLSKPIQRQYQPFGGPKPQQQSSIAQPQYAPQEPQQQAQPYQNFNDYDLDAYEQKKKLFTYVNQDASAHTSSAKLYEDRYDDFLKTKFKPYYQSLGGFDGDFETDDDYANAIEDMYKGDLALSQSEDGFFGESDEKKAARERLKRFTQWNSPNGLRDQFQRLKQEKEMRRALADRSSAQKSALMDQMTMLPRMQLDDALKARKAASSSKPRSKKATDEMLDQMEFEDPGMVNPETGLRSNLYRTDPRNKIKGMVNPETGKRSKDFYAQQDRMAAAMRGDMAGFMTRRESVSKDRQMRDRGMLFSQNGMLDGYPVGMSRMDTDILDIEKAQKMGIKEYKGRPIEEAFNELGGEERLNVAKIINAVRSAYSNREKAQIDWLAGNRKEELKAPMEEANESFEKALQLAAQFGLTDEIVEQTESKGFFSRMADSMKNAFSRGMKMNEMSKYADDFFLNAADQSEIEKFIQAAEELGEIPTSSAAKKFQNYKSKGFWDSVGNLLFDNAEAIPELFVESMSSFLPAYVRTGMYTIPGAAAAGGAAGLAGGPLAPATVTGGALSGAGIAARLNWGTASMVLEYSGMVLQGMQELNIDWQNPKVFAAAWNNQITRDAIKEKALKKGLPIALLDAFSGMMAGKISAALHHGGNAIKGGKLIDGAAWKRSKQTYPRFTNFQRGANIGLEIGADAAAGMGGEFLGQAWSKEPGEAWDYNAIAAEGLIGLGPGLLGGAYEFAAKPNVSFEGTPFDYEGVANTQTGQTGTVNLAGFRNQFHSFNDARPAAAHVLNEGNYANAEAKDNATRVLTDIMGRLYAINPDAMKDLKIVVADRTPYADKEMEGSYHFDNETQTSVIYINRNKIGQDPLGVFLHEAGHLARHLMMDKAELINIYDSIGPDAQNDAFAQYTLKIPEIKYSQLDDAQKAQVDKAKNSKGMSKLRMAEEWFSYQWANLLAGHKVDPSVKTEYQNFLNNVIHPAMEKFIGGETTGGSKEQKFNFDQMILRKMGFNPDGTPKEGPKFGQYYQERAGMAERFFGNDMPIQQMGDEEALNHLMRRVAVIAQTEGETRAKQVAEATNKILGKNILPTEMSAYTNLELQEAITPLGEAQIDAQDAVATAEVLETLEGKDAKAGVNELVEEVEIDGDTSTNVTETARLKQTLKQAELELQTAQNEFDSAKRAGQPKEQKSAGKRVVRAKQTIKGTKAAIEKAKNLPAKVKGQKVKVARSKKETDALISDTANKINKTQILMPGAEVTQKGDKFELRTRQPGTRKAGSAKTFDTKEAAEKAKEDFYKAELKKLKDTSQAVTNLKKLVLNEKDFEKEAAKVKAKLFKELQSKQRKDSKKELTEEDITFGQIIAEMMDLNGLQANAIFSSALAGDRLSELASMKAPDGQRVVQIFEEYEQKVESASMLIGQRILDLEKRKEEILNPEALGSAQAKEYKYTHKIVVVVNRAGNKIQYREWDGSKFGPKKEAERSAKGAKGKKEGDFIQKYNAKSHRYLSKEYAKAKAAAAKEKGIDPKYIQYKQNKAQGAPAKKAAAKPAAKAKAEPEKSEKKKELTKEQKAELTEINKKITMLKQYMDAIQPEKAAIDWKDTPHMTYHKYVGGPGEMSFKEENFERYTLGQLASTEREDDRIWQKVWNKKRNRHEFVQVNGVSDTQDYLFKYTNWRLNEQEQAAKPEPKAEVEKKTETETETKAAPEPEAKAVDEEPKPAPKPKARTGSNVLNLLKKKPVKNLSDIVKYEGNKNVATGGYSGTEVLREMEKSGSPLNKALAKRLLRIKLFNNVRVGWADVDSGTIRGEYLFNRKKDPGGVWITNKAAEDTVVHELMHALTAVKAGEYAQKGDKYVFKDKNMQKLHDAWDKAEDGLSGYEGSMTSDLKQSLKQFDEFLANIYTSKDLQDYLKTLDGETGKSLFTEILDLLSKILKFDPKGRTLLEESLNALDSFVESQSEQQDPTALGSGLANPDQSQAFNPFINGRKLTDKLPWFGDKTVQEYLDLLDAVRASAAMPEGVGEKAIGKAVKSEGKEVGQKDRIYFQPQKGTTVAAMMLFRLKEMDRKSGVNGRQLINGNLDRVTLSEMTVYELATGRAMEILDDRDFRGSKQQRYHQVIERKASEMAKDIETYEKLLAETDDAKEKERIERILNGSVAEVEAADPDSTPGKDVKGPKIAGLRQQLAALIFDYDEIGAFQGEETGGAFAKIHGGKVWTETLTEFMFYREKADAVQTILDIWEDDIANDQGPGMGKKPKERRNAPEQGAIDSWLVYQALKRSPDVTREQIEEALAEFRKKAEEAKGKFEETYAEKAAEEETQAAKAWGTETVAPDDYVFFGPGEKATSKVKETSAHGSFARGAVDEGIPVLAMFGKGRADNFNPEKTTFGTGSGSEQANIGLAADLDRKVNEQIQKKLRNLLNRKESQNIEAFEITKPDGKTAKVKRVNGTWKKGNNHKLPKDLQKIAEDTYINSRIDVIDSVNKDIENMDADAIAGVSSGAHVSAVQLVEFLLSQVKKKGFGKDALKNVMKSLEYNPSSQTSDGIVKQLPGGPAGGLLPYVWFDFITALHKKLKIKTDLKLTEASDPAKSGWTNIADEMIRTVIGENGKQTRILEKNDLYKNGIPDMDAMVEMVKPIIQAVYNSGRLRLNPGRGFDEKESNANSANASNILQRNPMLHDNPLDSVLGYEEAPEGSFDNAETDSATNKDQAKQTADDLEPEAIGNPRGKEGTTLESGVKKVRRTEDDEIILSPTELSEEMLDKFDDINKRLTRIRTKRGVSFEKVFKEFKEEPTFWEVYGLPAPTKPYPKWLKTIKDHPKFPEFKKMILDPDSNPEGPGPKGGGQKQKQFLFEDMLKNRGELSYGLGSSYSLSSGIPTNALKTSTVLTRMANKVGLDDEGKKALKEYFAKKKDDLKSGDIISSFVDQSRAGTKFISDYLKDLGIKDQKFLDSLDVRGLWHQYYGKTDEQVKQAEMRFIEPILDALNDHGISQEEFGEYLIARVAPSRNIHLKNMYTEMMNELDDGDKKNSLKEMLEKRGDNLSGVATDIAIKAVQKMEAEPAFLNFLQDSREPLQKFYDMNLEGLRQRSESGLIRSVGDINEAKAMRQASSFFNWKKDGGSKFSFKVNGKDDNYSYAPMQGFEGETETLYDNEQAYDIVGKSSAASGRAWDQPKNKFLFKGAFGRKEDAVGPDPKMVFAVARNQFFEGGVRGAKNEVSNSFGAAFEVLRAVAYHGKKGVKGEPLAELHPEILEKIKKDPSIIETTLEMFEGKDAIFKKDFKQMDVKKDYEIVEKDILDEDGVKVEGLKMVRRELSREFQNNQHVFVYRKNGVPHYIEFQQNPNGSRVARSVKNLKYEALPTFLKGVNSVTRFMASMFTSRNPAFIIPNFIRDLGTAFIHLSEDDKKKFVKAVFNPKRLTGFLFETMKVERKAYRGEIVQLNPEGLTKEEYAKKLIREGDYQKVYQLAKEAGAKVGYFRAKTVPELIEEMTKDTGKSKKGMRGKWNSFINYLDVANTGVENSIRMSAFASAVEAGYTVQQAATISRNVTVDFNQKGEMTQTMGSLFVFFGASMNSMHRMMSTFKKRSPKERAKLIGGIATASFVLNLFNRLMDDDEDEPVPDYDTISEYRRDTMAIIGDPRDKNTGYFGMPIPLGYNMFWTLGQTAGDFFAKYVMGRGGAGAVDFLTRNLNASLNAFNPVGGSSLTTAMIPTVGKPLAELWANQNFMGMPIRNEDRQYEAPKPAHMMDPKRTQEHWTELSKGLNSLLGGDDQLKGSVGGMFGSNPLKSLSGTDLKFDISGSQMEHLLLGYAGGPGQIVNMLFGGLVFPALSEQKDYGTFDPNKMPIANRFYRSSTHGSHVKNLYYQVREANKIAERVVKAAKTAGPKEFSIARDNMKELLTLSANVKYADAFKKKIATQKLKVEKDKKLTQDQKLQRIAQLEQREHDAYVKVIKKAQSLGIS